jgi:hypothetical protein
MRTTNRNLTCGLLLGCVVVLLTSSCGGGGGGGNSAPPMSLMLSTSAVTFKAAGPYAAAPATQTVTGTVTGVTTGTVYFKIVANNAIANSPNGLFTVANLILSGNSGQADVIPALPSSIGAGSFKGSITVTACLNDPSCQTGQITVSPQNIAINYDIASGVDGNTVTPHVVSANSPGTVILRGAGFSGATAVGFGSMAAASMTVVSDSQITAAYPALPAGMYPVTVSGNTNYSVSLVVVSPPAFTATAVPYPTDFPSNFQELPRLEYDAQRTALYLLIPGGVSTNATLLRYAFDGTAWGAATELSMAGLVQVHLSPDGTQLLALIAPDGGHTSMAELDPVTLAQTNITTVTNHFPSLDSACGFALANDGNAMVSNADSFGFAFGTFSGVFTALSDGGGCNPVASGNGAIVAMTVSRFDASSESILHPGPQTDTGASGDFAGDKWVYSGQVQTQTGQLLGYANGLYGQVINSGGTRLYGVTPDPVSSQPTLVTVDLTATPIVNPDPVFPQIGTPVTLPGCAIGSCPQFFYSLAITPDGATVFVAAPTYFVVQPISP